ncbi:MAG: acyl carrier protein [Anaerovoracaceae bacterium]|jgi:acyl carrier protein|nr:acyl carrier protein [Anaerovoracaceae bacterium]
MSFEQVKEVMVETLNCEEEDIKPEALLEDDLGIDSLDAVELALALEELFGVKIPDEELSEMKTVKDIVDCMDRNRA